MKNLKIIKTRHRLLFMLEKLTYLKKIDLFVQLNRQTGKNWPGQLLITKKNLACNITFFVEMYRMIQPCN